MPPLVAVGVLTHHASVTSFVRDLLLFLGCWFMVALIVRLYTHRGGRRLLATWLLGVSLAVGLRAAAVGHFAVDFYAVALAFTALFVVAARLLGKRVF